ncbi:P-loop containing nucleoside triphosphate hydrolase protein [Hysterangium stoloniferum]|nr:P-loop containing nucleoside triphosphate hydrolase protein [Hysterangium stoloniferum]
MSRHRFIKNINIDDELEDDALSDGGEADLSPEQQVQLDTAVAQVRSIFGSEDTSGISNAQIRDAAWEFYFDVEQTVDWLLAAKKEEKASRTSSKTKKPSSSQFTSAATSRAAPAAATSRTASPAPAKPNTSKITGLSPAAAPPDQRQFDIAALNLDDDTESMVEHPIPKVTLAREKVLADARLALEGDNQGRKSVSLVVIGHVDAGKSTLMGRLLYELGKVGEKKRIANERASEKIGKSSFSWAWELDGTLEERERGVTMDIALQNFQTPSRNVTLLDAPGHRDFIPNMISGASQADCALLVVDASTGEFEAGFQRGGQTKEHLLLVRSLGVSQVVVAVNKLDQVNWDDSRYTEIVEDLRPFLLQSGFLPSKTKFVPVSAMMGINLNKRAKESIQWYEGPTLVDLIDQLDPPIRLLDAPLRIPISNVFKGQTSLSAGLGVSGRVCSGVVQVGERLRVLPGDESAIVRRKNHSHEAVPWAAAGANVTLYLSGIDPIHLSVGIVLCPQSDLVPLVTKFVAQVITFDMEIPITAGAIIELFHQSSNVPATISKLLATLDRSTATVIKQHPRVLGKHVSAKIEVTLRSSSMNEPASQAMVIPLETFEVNKDMGRILLRRGGETIAAGQITIQLI